MRPSSALPSWFTSRLARAALLFGSVSSTGCGGGGTVEVSAEPADLLPFADAGSDHVGRVGTLVSLDGRASADPEGQPQSFHWVQTDGPFVALADTTSARPEFTPVVPGTYVFDLVVGDGANAPGSAPARVTVLVIDDVATQPRRAPGAVAHATGLLRVTFLASLPDPAAGLPDVVLADGSVRPVVFVDLASEPTDDPPAGAVASLEAIDVVAAGASRARAYVDLQPGDEDPVRLRVPAGSGGSGIADILAYGVAGAAFVLDGSRSTDDGVVRTYSWAQASGPFGFATADAGIGIVPNAPGTYVFDLVVADDGGLSSFPQRVSIPVLPSIAFGAGPPRARAVFASGTLSDGDDDTPEVAVVGSTVVLSGAESVSHASGTPMPAGTDSRFSWRQLRGPAATLVGTEGSALSVVPKQPGAYAFELTVTDAWGVSDATIAHLSVVAPGQPAATPVLRPILDAVLPDPAVGPLLVALDGTQSSGAGPLTFRWRQTAGMPLFIENAESGLGVVQPVRPGLYAFELRVFDGSALSAPVERSFRVR